MWSWCQVSGSSRYRRHLLGSESKWGYLSRGDPIHCTRRLRLCCKQCTAVHHWEQIRHLWGGRELPLSKGFSTDCKHLWTQQEVWQLWVKAWLLPGPSEGRIALACALVFWTRNIHIIPIAFTSEWQLCTLGQMGHGIDVISISYGPQGVALRSSVDTRRNFWIGPT